METSNSRNALMVVPELASLTTGPSVRLLWDSLAETLQGPAEVDYFRGLLGDRLQMNASVSEELTNLIEILTDMRSASPHAAGTTSSAPPRPLALPSGSKELLQERLRKLILHARVPAEEMFKTPREKQIADHLVRPPSSASSTRSRDSRPTSVGSSSSSRGAYTDPTKSLVNLKGSLRFDKIHEVKDAVLECFKVEYDQIVEDVEYVRELIEEEMFNSRQIHGEPTFAELKDLTKKVEEAEAHFAHVEMIQRLPAPTKRGSLAALK